MISCILNMGGNHRNHADEGLTVHKVWSNYHLKHLFSHLYLSPVTQGTCTIDFGIKVSSMHQSFAYYITFFAPCQSSAIQEDTEFLTWKYGTFSKRPFKRFHKRLM